MPQDDPRTEKEPTRQQRGASSRSEQTRGGTTAAAEEMATRVGDLGTSTLNAGLRMQTEMFDTLRTIGREWMERKTSEAEFALNLPTDWLACTPFPKRFPPIRNGSASG